MVPSLCRVGPGRGALRLRYVEIELCLHGAFDDLRGAQSKV